MLFQNGRSLRFDTDAERVRKAFRAARYRPGTAWRDRAGCILRGHIIRLLDEADSAATLATAGDEHFAARYLAQKRHIRRQICITADS
jgi:hypothetical protein